ncbi:hypothetical protein RI129_002120 [Pyrocoelia pectoralis]|uniref:Hexosyltransferase n=1 Tax=Pyrocoelia pectoralis TaxID=417401 RepID=A0AAN7ZSS1_9COLE
MQRYRARRWLLVTCFICALIFLIVYIYEERMATIDGWSKTTSRDAAVYINPTYSTLLTKPKNLCPLHTYLMIIVCSSPSNFEQRIAVRETWGLFKNTTAVKLYFLLGKTDNTTIQDFARIEYDLYQDIIVENFVDTYNNLTIKSLMLLKLVKFECKDKVKYVMKVDDDTFVNMNNLFEALMKVKRKSTIFGKLICRSRPVRDYYEKWFVPRHMYVREIYPNYLSGVAYVMTADIAVKLFNTALTVPLLYLEDVYVTGLCTKAAGIIPEMNGEFNNNKIKFDPCKYKKLITSHYNSPIEMRSLHYHVHHDNLEEDCKTLRAEDNAVETNLDFLICSSWPFYESIFNL